MSNILIISSFNNMAPRGLNKIDAMAKAVEQQMRPVMMMALSGCFGLLPAAISTGIGSEVQRPLATVVVGGMLIGRVLLLVFVPPLANLFPGLAWPTRTQHT
jgi:heavy metal efflux system protein